MLNDKLIDIFTKISILFSLNEYTVFIFLSCDIIGRSL